MNKSKDAIFNEIKFINKLEFIKKIKFVKEIKATKVIKVNKKIKLVVAIILMICMMSIKVTSVNAAEVVGIDGGIRNSNYYGEYVFVSGSPVKFTGTAVTSIVSATTTTATAAGTSKETVKISYNLKGEDGKSTLKRNLTYDRVISDNTDYAQNIKCAEAITIGKTTYTLSTQGGYQLSKADTISQNAGINFLTGDWNAIKTYNLSGDRLGTLTVQVQGREASNQNYWGEAHFQLIKMNMDYEPSITQTQNAAATTSTANLVTTVPWQGSVEIRTSSQRYGSLNYQSSLPVTTAYKGTYTRTDNPIAKVIYQYDLPASTTDETLTNRLKGTKNINLRDNPDIKKYVAKNLKDVVTKSGTNPIQRMTSLDIVSAGEYYSPNINITRADFLKALLRACNIKSDQKKVSTYPAPKDLFTDVTTKNPYYAYIRDGLNYGIITGVRGAFFKPDSPITRSEAAAMITKALGLHDSPYVEGVDIKFKDETAIPSWAKQDLYTLAKLGIMKTDAKGNIYSNINLTRSEAANTLNNLLTYLQNNLQKDYDSLIKFN